MNLACLLFGLHCAVAGTNTIQSMPVYTCTNAKGEVTIISTVPIQCDPVPCPPIDSDLTS